MSKSVIHRTTDITVSYLKDTRLSLQAWGLLSFLLLNGENYSCSIDSLSKISKSGSTAVRSALNELKQFGYLVVSPLKNDSGRIYDWQYEIFETTTPIYHDSTIPIMEKPLLENPVEENPHVEKTNINNITITTDNNTTSIKEEIYKEEKKLRKEKKKFDLSFVGVLYKDAFNMWLEYKAQIGNMYKTQKSIELCYSNLLKLSNNDPNTFTKIIEQSIANNWKGLFALKDLNNSQNNKHYGKSKFNDPARAMACVIAGFNAADTERHIAEGTL